MRLIARRRAARRGIALGTSALIAAAVVALAFGGGDAPASRGLAPTPGDQSNPVVASDGTGFLVAWEDANGPTAARVDADGTNLDPEGIPLADEGYDLDIAFDGTNYLVVWTSLTGFSRADIRAARVTPQGVDLDPGGFVLTEHEQFGAYSPHVAFDGENYLVSYENCYCIRAVRVHPDGTILHPFGIGIAGQHFPQRNGVSYGAGEYLVTWNSSEGVLAARVLPDGTVLDFDGRIVVAHLANLYAVPASTFDGTNFVVTWADDHLDGQTPRVYAARITPDGTLLDQQPIPITPAPQPLSVDPRAAASAESSL